MPAHKILGFYDFHITADKTRDFFLANDFKPGNLVLSKIEKGQKFYLTPEGNDHKEAKTEQENPLSTVPEPHYHTIGQFLKNLFNKGAVKNEEKHVIADRDGFILIIVPESDEQAQVAKETLHKYRANYIQEFNS